MPEEWARNHLGGVVGVRLIKELRGQEAIVMDEYKDKKMIATTRMFGNAVTDLSDIKEAIATYTARTAEKLRRQHSAAGMINVFVVTNYTGIDPEANLGGATSSRGNEYFNNPQARSIVFALAFNR